MSKDLRRSGISWRRPILWQSVGKGLLNSASVGRRDGVHLVEHPFDSLRFLGLVVALSALGSKDLA